MAKKRRRRSRVERGTRAKPQRIKTIQRLIRKPLILEKVPEASRIVTIKKNKEVQAKNFMDQLSKVIKIHKIPRCKAIKAKARHEYFSMRKSGKGGSRQNPLSNRFTVRC